jgi:hypothetical protein
MEDVTTPILIVANRTAATPQLLEAVRERAAAGPCEFVLLVPEERSEGKAEQTLAHALPLLAEAAGGPVEGIVGDEDPFTAVLAALRDLGFDEVIVSTLPRRVSEWLRRDLPRRIERLGIPVTTVSAR